jgi:hypothetical protein
MTDLFPDLGRPVIKSIEINKVHRDILPNSRGNRKRLEGAWGFECFSLVALTHLTFNEKTYGCPISYPPRKKSI